MNLRSNKSTPKKEHKAKIIKIPVPRYKSKQKALYVDNVEYQPIEICEVFATNPTRYNVRFLEGSKKGLIKKLADRDIMDYVPKWKWHIYRIFSRIVF